MPGIEPASWCCRDTANPLCHSRNSLTSVFRCWLFHLTRNFDCCLDEHAPVSESLHLRFILPSSACLVCASELLFFSSALETFAEHPVKSRTPPPPYPPHPALLFFTAFTTQLEYHFPRAGPLCSESLLYPQCLKQCLAHSKALSKLLLIHAGEEKIMLLSIFVRSNYLKM